MTKKPTEVLFLDMDGTVRKPITAGVFIQNPMDQELIEGVANAIAHFKELGFRFVGISNQAGISAGHKSLGQVVAEMRQTIKLLPDLEAIYFSPDFTSLSCVKVPRDSELNFYETNHDVIAHPEKGFRKPAKGMVELAISELGLPEGTNYIFVGDRDEDYETAKNAKISFIWASEWRSPFIYRGEGNYTQLKIHSW